MGDIFYLPFFIGFLMLRIGFDIHGVIDTNPEYFASIIKGYRDQGHAVHIITGSPLLDMKDKLSTWGVEYDAYFSISDWCLSHSKTARVREDGDVFDDDDVWNTAKAIYCMKTGIDIHIDDSLVYMPTFKNIVTRFFLYDGTRSGIHTELKQVISSANDNCEHFPCSKGCPQYILYREKVRRVISESSLACYASNDYPGDVEDGITELVESIFEELG